MTKLRTFLTCAAAICSLAAIGASTAHAGAFPYAEPSYTKTNGNNAFWFHWKAESGVTAGGATSNVFYTCANTHRDSTQIEAHQGTNGPGAFNCTGSLTGAQGDQWWIPGTTSTVLDDGHYYSMCVSGWHLYGVWSNDNLSAPDNCARTVIDRNKPSIAVGVDGDKTVTNDPNLQLSIGYQDATSPPWFGANGVASNWTCISRGGPCQPSGAPDADCSVPQNANSRINAFHCQANVANEVDGDYYFCAYVADAAMPDNPNGSNQLGGTSNQANLSDVACGHVVVDRAAPAVTAGASKVSAQVGTLIDFSGSATDPSGIAAGLDWDFGDNTQHATGTTASHTYTQPGTYKVKLGAKDNAGNAGEGAVTLTITKAADNNDNNNNDNTNDDNGKDDDGSTVVKTQEPPKETVIVKQNGGEVQTTALGNLDVIAPRKFKSGRRQMVLALTPDSAGKIQVSLLKGSKVVSSGSAIFDEAATYQMKLPVPKKLKPGRY